MTVEVLYFDGCPGYEALLPRLRELLHEAGVKETIELRQVQTPQAAERERFLGSPPAASTAKTSIRTPRSAATLG